MASAILAQNRRSPSDADCAMRMALFVPLTVDLQEKFERRFNTPVIRRSVRSDRSQPVHAEFASAGRASGTPSDDASRTSRSPSSMRTTWRFPRGGR